MFWSKDVSRLERKNGELELEIVIDFDNMDVFSIERNVTDGVGHTILGYWLEDQYGSKSNHEWFLFCSDETHEKLVSEFKKHIKAEKLEN